MKQIVILLSGNFLHVTVSDGEVLAKMLEIITASIRDGNWVSVHDEKGVTHTSFNGAKIEGWYVREPLPDRQGEIVDLVKKAVEQGESGDEWKK